MVLDGLAHHDAVGQDAGDLGSHAGVHAHQEEFVVG